MNDLTKILGTQPVSYSLHAVGGCTCGLFVETGHIQNCVAKRYFILMYDLDSKIYSTSWLSLN